MCKLNQKHHPDFPPLKGPGIIRGRNPSNSTFRHQIEAPLAGGIHQRVTASVPFCLWLRYVEDVCTFVSRICVCYVTQRDSVQLTELRNVTLLKWPRCEQCVNTRVLTRRRQEGQNQKRRCLDGSRG